MGSMEAIAILTLIWSIALFWYSLEIKLFYILKTRLVLFLKGDIWCTQKELYELLVFVQYHPFLDDLDTEIIEKQIRSARREND